MSGNTTSQILRGAAMGGGILCLLVVAALVFRNQLSNEPVGKRGEGLRRDLQLLQGKLNRENRIPPDCVTVCNDLIARGLQEDSGLFTPWIVAGVLQHTLMDGAASDADRDVLRDCLVFLEANPSPNPVSVGNFLDAHAELAELRNTPAP